MGNVSTGYGAPQQLYFTFRVEFDLIVRVQEVRVWWGTKTPWDKFSWLAYGSIWSAMMLASWSRAGSAVSPNFDILRNSSTYWVDQYIFFFKSISVSFGVITWCKTLLLRANGGNHAPAKSLIARMHSEASRRPPPSPAIPASRPIYLMIKYAVWQNRWCFWDVGSMGEWLLGGKAGPVNKMQDTTRWWNLWTEFIRST